MTECKLLILMILSMVRITNSITDKQKYKTIHKLHRTGEGIAVEVLIRKFEREHRKLYDEEINGGDCLEWPALDNKNLSNYCKMYLQESIPNRNFDDVTGNKIRKILNYEKENTRITSKVVIVHCKVANKSHLNSYYLTRAYNTNCAYALKSSGIRKKFIYNIINEQCNFENKPLINRLAKRKRMEFVESTHQFSGQPIAKDNYLQEFELEHQELLKREDSDVNYVEWLHVILHPNLDAFCSQYMKVCVPRRNRKGAKGNWKIQKLQYQKLNTNEDIQVTVVTCHANVATHLQYYFTRALETHCAYALLRQGSIYAPFIIIFKHCDFEESNDYRPIPQNNDMHDKDVILKTEVKEETFDTLEMLKLFPSH